MLKAWNFTKNQLYHRYFDDRSSPPLGVLIKRCSENMQLIYKRTPIPKCDFNKVVKFNILAGVFLYKFAAYFQNTFSLEHWRAASVNDNYPEQIFFKKPPDKYF